MRRRYTDSDLLREFPLAFSITDLCRRLGLKQAGGSFTVVKKNCDRLGLDWIAIKGTEISKSKLIPGGTKFRMADSDVFCNPTKYKSPSKVKQKALNAGYVENYCQICGQKPFWNGKKMILILDHIDGNNKNNLPNNLRCVCPNCNVQLETNCGKNIG